MRPLRAQPALLPLRLRRSATGEERHGKIPLEEHVLPDREDRIDR